jgi:PAS domain S-box-containing protein
MIAEKRDRQFHFAEFRMSLTLDGLLSPEPERQRLSLSGLLDAIDEGVAVHEAVYREDGRIRDARTVSANRRFRELVGLADEPGPRLATEAFGTAAQLVLDTFGQAASAGRPLRVGVAFERRYCIVSVAPMGGPRFATVVIDITAEKRAQVELEEQRAFTNALIDSIPGILYVYDSHLRLVRWNRLHEELTGFTAEEMLHRNGMDWFDEEDRALAERAQENIRGKGYNIVRVRLICKSGERKPFLMTAVRSPIGGEFYFLGIGIDLTDLEKAERARAELEARLAEAHKLESLGRLAGGVAHDFNNMLTVIDGYAAMLAAGPIDDESRRAFAEEIRSAGARAAELTMQLLAFSRRQTIRTRPLSLNRIVGECENMLRRLAGEDIALTVALQPDLGRIIADPSQIYQILLNLVANARDAMPNGGRLRIETANVACSQEDVDAHPEAAPGPCVLLSVIDTGVGMSAEVRQQLFEPFFTTKGQGHGTGLGLATVYGIVRQSSGWIWVDSEPGSGSTFRICFPRTEAEWRDEPAAPPAARTDCGDETILVVEDQDSVRTLAELLLTGHGFRVLTARNAEEALAALDAHDGPVHLLLTDVVLPTLNGRQLADRVRRRSPRTRVLYTSGYSANVIVNRGVLAAGIAYLPKPFSRETLLEKVRETLSAAEDPPLN